MKSQFLKIAGVKSEKAFYKKFPTEAAFFKAHPEAKKMANGGEQDKGQIKKLQQLTDFGNPPIAQIGKKIPFDPSNPFAFTPNLNTQGLTGGLGAQQPTDFGQFVAGMGQSKRAAANSYGQMFGNFQTGKDLSAGIKSPLGAADSLKGMGGLDKLAGKAAPYISSATDIIEGIGMIGAQREAKQQAKQQAQLTGLFSKAAETRPEEIERRYVRPEDVMVQPDQLFPSYGVGTNVLAEDGAVISQIGGNPGEIANTFAPNTIYTDMGYEPLNDTSRVKAYYNGGKLIKAQGGLSASLNSGGFADFMSGGGGDMLSGLAENLGTGGRGPSAGSKIGGGILGGVGTALGGPVGGMIGKTIGTLAGGLLDKTGRQIDRYNDQSNRNISNVVAQQTGMRLQNQFGNYLKDGGWVSHDWTPQLITKFGDYDMKDLLAPDPTMDTLRTGGNIRSNRMFETDQFAMGGDLKVYRGEAEPISTNPYLPEGGETVMFRGPSHENGGMPIEYGSSPVEVEGGEPAVKLQDGTSGDSNLVVYGNLINPKTGKKFKKDAEMISKNEAKQNKKIDKASKGLENLNVNTAFDKLELDTYNAILTGANMKLKQYAEDKMDLAALQSAINDTAEEYSLIADDLAKGKVKPDTSKDGKAKYGTKLTKAAEGITLADPIQGLLDLLKKKGYAHTVRSTVREGAKTAQGRQSRHSVGEAADVAFPELGSKAYRQMLYDSEIANYMLDNNITMIDEYHPKTLTATKGTGPHIHFGYDKGTSAADKFREDATKLYRKDVTYGGVDPKKETYSKKGVQPGMIDYNPIGSEGVNPLFASEESYKNQWLPKVGKAFDNPETAKKIIKAIEDYAGDDADDVKAAIAKEKTLSGKIAKAYELGTDMKPGPYHNVLNSIVDVVVPTPPTTTPTTTLPGGATPPKITPPWSGLVNTILPFLRPTDAEALDTAQLTPELFALTNNQLEPVFAQKYNPQLLSPFDISLQDQLNANQADFNAMQRQIGNDPAALASLAAQKYAANSKVLGEQMRINQANKANIYNTNINTMNQAQLKNLDILDQQYVRQEQARSNTRATTLEALKSISDKYAQNKLANRKLATYENLYNYRYDPNFRAQNMNPLAKFNIPTVTNKLPIYDSDNKIIGYQQADGTAAPAGATPPYVAPGSRTTATTSETTTKSPVSRNGSIVKALKNL